MFLSLGKTGNQVSAFSDSCSTEVPGAKEQARSVKWGPQAELCEGQGRWCSRAGGLLPTGYGE